MQNLLFAIGSVLPVFLMVGVGWFIRKKDFITKEYCSVSARFNFRFCFPALVFDSLYSSDISRLFTGKLAALALLALAITLALSVAGGYAATKDRQARGSFIQGAFRGNIVLMAMPMVLQVFGEESRAQTAIIMAIIVPSYNVISVLILTLSVKGKKVVRPMEIARSILTNPMIIGVLAALPFALTGTGLPRALTVFIKYFAGMTVPLALLDIGAGMVGRSRPKNAGKVIFASLIKTVAGPVVYGGVFALGGMDDHLVALMVLLGSAPTAMAGFTMAKVMGCDAELAGDIVLVTTLISAFTIAASIAFLRFVGLA
ncbi:MAG: AEC family transporter [Rectinemataceae bacterium]|nr:AEC family transporter [Rectinemataceae bacterium]